MDRGSPTSAAWKNGPDGCPRPASNAALGRCHPMSPAGRTRGLGARGMYLYSANKDTLYRIHGTNQPEYIGSAVWSCCIRMTNEDLIDLYARVKVGTPVVVLGPGHGDLPWSARMAATSAQPARN